MITQDVGTEVTLTGQRRGAEEYVEIHFTVTIGIKEQKEERYEIY